MKKIRKGDDVIIIAGKDKKKVGKVLSVLSDDRVIVAGVNQVKKHVKPNPSKNETGGIVSKTMPVHVSNVAIYNSETKSADRIGFRYEDGKKVRFLKSNGKLVG